MTSLHLNKGEHDYLIFETILIIEKSKTRQYHYFFT